ncbi:MAG: serine/threonine-protein phosphatase [Eubacteriales bacterium]|nr:serine/threonine-protein phosphatase [Eubacteriales bacterium]
MRIKFYTATDRGTREYQQDAAEAKVWEDLGIAALCDGMGGLNGGEKASNLAVKRFFRDLDEAWPVLQIPDFLENEARILDRAVYDLADGDGNRLNAGSTLVAVIIDKNRLYWVSVGDSRLYLLRNGKMRCLTAAHNYKTMLREKLAQGQIDMNYYNTEIQQGEALTSYLGMGRLSLIDRNFSPVELLEEDILLLCSDGLYKTLSDEQIQAVVEESGGHISLAGERLLEIAGRWGARGQDNTTLILMKPEAEKNPGGTNRGKMYELHAGL